MLGIHWSPHVVDADELKKRTKLFALRILKLGDALPATIEGKTIKGQLVRAGTSVGANYRAACRGRSRAEFIAKIGVVEEEADESAFWLELIIEGAFLKADRVRPLLDEANELTRIMASSRISASRRVRANRQSAIGNRQSQ
jgi:four helix bundle protein